MSIQFGRRFVLAAALAVVALSSSGAAAVVSAQPASATSPPRQGRLATIPFELVTRHIVVKVSVNKSRPLSFILDTGANTAIIRSDVAKELGLETEGSVRTGGAGAGFQVGAFVRNATWSLLGLDKFSQKVSLALPLAELPPAMGQEVDGIIGTEFIGQFVVGIDYQAQTLTLYDRDSFKYDGDGQSIPIELNANNHPILQATVTPPGGQPIERTFTLDLGSSGALIMHSPFVREQNLLSTQEKTVRLIGAAGAGGQTNGRVGRMDSIKIGRFTLARPYTMFSEDKAGAFANPQLAGNIGAQIASRFRLFLDYGRRRIILEPSPTFGESFDRASAGLALRASGPDYRTFRVLDLLEDSPATDAGIESGDIITSVNSTPASALTLSGIHEMFEKPGTFVLGLRRGDRTLDVKLTTRKVV